MVAYLFARSTQILSYVVSVVSSLAFSSMSPMPFKPPMATTVPCLGQSFLVALGAAVARQDKTDSWHLPTKHQFHGRRGAHGLEDRLSVDGLKCGIGVVRPKNCHGLPITLQISNFIGRGLVDLPYVLVVEPAIQHSSLCTPNAVRSRATTTSSACQEQQTAARVCIGATVTASRTLRSSIAGPPTCSCSCVRHSGRSS